MSKFEFKLNTKNVRTEILQADWMKTYIEQEARKQANADDEVKTFVGFDRAKAIIYSKENER